MLLHPHVDLAMLRATAVDKDAQNQAYSLLIDLTYEGLCTNLEQLENV